MQQHKITLILLRPHMAQRQRIQAFGQSRQLMIMCSKQASATIGFMNAFNHRPRNGKAVIG